MSAETGEHYDSKGLQEEMSKCRTSSKAMTDELV